MRSPFEENVRWQDRLSTPGTLHLVCGCMFAGKTESLLDEVESTDPRRVQVFKPAIDDRYHRTRVVSHRGRNVAAIIVETPAEIIKRTHLDVGLVAVDEVHFFDESFVDVCGDLVERGLQLLTVGLDRDSWGEPFPMMERLRDLADFVSVKRADCARCDAQATRTQRLTPIFDGRMVGGAEAFEPRCVQCWTPPPGSADQITRPASNTGPCVQQSS